LGWCIRWRGAVVWCARSTGACISWAKKRFAEKRQLLTMEFKRFLNAFIRVPAQIVRTGRRVLYRLLAWNPWQHVFLRAAEVLEHPLRC
jgi:hypothetical protein